MQALDTVGVAQDRCSSGDPLCSLNLRIFAMQRVGPASVVASPPDRYSVAFAGIGKRFSSATCADPKLHYVRPAIHDVGSKVRGDQADHSADSSPQSSVDQGLSGATIAGPFAQRASSERTISSSRKLDASAVEETIQITVNIPDELVAALRRAFGNDLNGAVLENFAVEGYRAGKLSRFQVQTILGFDNRWETENWLGDRGVNMSYSLDDLRADRDTLDRVLGR